MVPTLVLVLLGLSTIAFPSFYYNKLYYDKLSVVPVMEG
jgi:hypothetical protein